MAQTAPGQDRFGFWHNPNAPFSGRLVYAWDTGPVVLSGLSNEPPWRSFLTLHTFAPGYDRVLTREINAPKYQAVLQPQFSPDGNKVLFQVGDIGSQFSTSVLFLWDLNRARLTDLHASLYSDEKPLWSPDGRFFARPVGGRPSPDISDPPGLRVYEIATGRDRAVKNAGDGFAWEKGDRSPSPDNHWLAYFRVSGDSSETASWRLMLRPRRGGRARLIGRGRDLVTALRWQPDSRRLVIVTRRGVSDARSQAHIALYDVASGRVQTVVTLPYGDYSNAEPSASLFAPLFVSRNNQWLFVVVTQPRVSIKAGRGEFLRAVRLRDGAVSTLCFVPGYHGLDWQEQGQTIYRAPAMFP